MRIITVLFLLSVIVLPAFSAANDNYVKVGPVNYTIEPILDADWVCYLQDDNLYAMRYGSKPFMIKGKESGATSSIILMVSGEKVFIAWNENAMGNNSLHIIVLGSSDGELLQKDTELLKTSKTLQARFVKDNNKIWLFALAHSETPEIMLFPLSEGNIAARAIQGKLEEATPVYNPAPVIGNNMLYLFYSTAVNNRTILAARKFDMSLLKPAGYDVLKETDGISFIEAVQTADSPVLLYKPIFSGKYSLEGFIRDGEAWKHFSLAETAGLDVARMDSRVWDDGRIVLVYSGEDRGVFKQRIFSAASSDKGRSWKVERLDNREADNTRAWLPRLAADNLLVAAVWEDSRDIRSGIRLKFSSDSGNSWVKKDILLSEKSFSAFRPRISSINGSFFVAWLQFRDDEKKVADLYLKKITRDEMFVSANVSDAAPSPEEKISLLKQRLGQYWDAMIKKDMKTAYEIHDPFFRARMPYEFFAAGRGPMSYKSYNIGEIRIEGNVASVKLKVVYEIPKLHVLGKDTSVPAQEVAIEDTYLFINGVWYRKFVDALSGGSAIEY